MKLLTIRKHRRFAVRHGALLERCGSGHGEATGLLVELSLEGCRVAGNPAHGFAIGDRLRVCVDGFDAIAGEVRWADHGCIGLRFDRPLHIAALETMILTCRDQAATRACA